MLKVEWLGLVEYGEGLERQARALAEVQARQAEGAGAHDRLLLLEHPPVVTLGRSSHEEHLLVSRETLAVRGIGLHEVARGGDVTFHAPGQLVGYPIVDLTARGRDVHRFLRDCEGALIDALAELGLPARRVEGKTGVFMEPESDAGPGAPERKIASIGVGVKRWVTCHGFALNVDLDLEGFDVIVPCGLEGVEMTSIEAERQRAGDANGSALAERARAVVAAAFERRFA